MPRTEDPTPGQDAHLDRLLDHIRLHRNADLTRCDRSVLLRHIDQRVDALGLADYGDYLDLLQVRPDELGLLFDAVLVSDTALFDDRDAWIALAKRVRGCGWATDRRTDIRVWSAGTAGFESYSLAILFADLLGVEDCRDRVKVFGTDIDDDALAVSRTATFAAASLARLTRDQRDRYLEPVDELAGPPADGPGQPGERFALQSDMRRMVVFGHHDLARDEPISPLNLIMCRNTLLYFDAETQARVLRQFHAGLSDEGLLVLGPTETLRGDDVPFSPVDLERRIFQRRPASRPGRSASQRDPRATPPPPSTAGPAPGPVRSQQPTAPERLELYQLLFDAASQAQLVTDIDGHVLLINAPARQMFGLEDNDIGRAVQDLPLPFPPLELRSSIATAFTERRTVLRRDIEHRYETPDVSVLRIFDSVVQPLIATSGTEMAVSISFTDVTLLREQDEATAKLRRELDAAHDELQSTNNELQTTNVELQSTIDELETTTEELQSTDTPATRPRADRSAIEPESARPRRSRGRQ